jgi:hypothetical protein
VSGDAFRPIQKTDHVDGGFAAGARRTIERYGAEPAVVRLRDEMEIRAEIFPLEKRHPIPVTGLTQ